jgi:hypothetical protein
MKLINSTRLIIAALALMFLAPSCVKEGPMGLTGPAGANGTNGTDANETCKMCHKSTSVDMIATQFQFSKHEYGEAAFEEAGNVGCTPCHAQEAFKYVVKNNVPSTFSPDPTKPGFYKNDYATIASAAYGEIGCSTCHSSLHTTYGTADLAFTTVAPVPMTMWGGKKTIDVQADGGKSNLCIKCHQPRPFTNLLTGNVLDYEALASNPTGIVFDGNPIGATNIIKPSYRTHTHYGSVGAIYAGKGGVEFPGTLPYTSSTHATAASCSDCHMGAMNERAGGHTFKVRNASDGVGLVSTTKWNLATCKTAGCHTTDVTSTSTTLWTAPRADIKKQLDALAAKLTINGIDILNRNPDPVTNLWAGLTTNNYDGYLNIFDPITNPKGKANNASSFRYNGTASAPVPANWSAEDKAYNATLPYIKLTNAQMGALINFQLCLREYSLGIHNYKYSLALLTNSIAKL